MGRLREAVRGLTPRGRGLVVAGLGAAAAGYGLGSPDLVRLGVFLLVLPAVAAAVTVGVRRQLVVARALDAGRVVVGEPAHVTLELRAPRGRWPTGELLLEDRLPAALGGPVRSVLERLDPGRPRRLGYTVVPDVRGRHAVGPLVVRVTDPFGLVELPRTAARRTGLLAVPAVEDLPRRDGSRRGDDLLAGSAALRLGGGQPDVTLRDYRSGDDLRRVHWRASARHGDLLVRAEEQEPERAASVLVDDRRRAHVAPPGQEDGLETAVRVAAAVAAHLLRAGRTVRVVTAGGRVLFTGAGQQRVPAVQDALGEMPAGDGTGLAAGAAACAGPGASLVVAAVGTLSADDAASLRAALPVGSAVVHCGRSRGPSCEVPGLAAASVGPGGPVAPAWQSLAARSAPASAVRGGTS